jgi:hypothetical protein
VTIQHLFMFAVMGLFLTYSLYTVRKRKRTMPDATRMFLERTGYRYADILAQPLAAHIHHGEQLMRRGSKGYRVHLVRDFHGMAIHNVATYSVAGSESSMAYTWSLPLAHPLRYQLQVADKNLRGLGKNVKELFSNHERVWSQRYPHRVTTGDRELDARFNIYSDQPEAALPALHALGPLLLSCVAVDLVTTPSSITFSDPTQRNVASAMGGVFGAMMIGGDAAKHLELQIPVHDLIAKILATTHQACA